MSERKMVSRRGMLALAGGSVVGAAAVSVLPAGAQELSSGGQYGRNVVTGYLSNHQPIAPSLSLGIAQTDQEEAFLAHIVTTVPLFPVTGQPMRVLATIEVPALAVGKLYQVRVGMQEDTGAERIEVLTEPATVPSQAFTVQVNKGDNRPGEDWNLTENRVFVMISSISVLDEKPFGLAPSFPFKVVKSA